MALACQEVYGKPVSELFAGLNESVARDSRDRMKRMQTRLQASADPQSTGSKLMRKFQWISQRLLEMPNFKLVSV